MLKNKMLKYRVMEFHRDLVKRGQYIAARKVLRFLKEGNIRLGLGDVDFHLETQLEKLGCKTSYTGRNYTCHAHLKAN